MHRGQLEAALAFSRLPRNKIASAVILAVADIVEPALVRRYDHPRGRDQKHYSPCNDTSLLHTNILS
jgi:hypothetical protein